MRSGLGLGVVLAAAGLLAGGAEAAQRRLPPLALTTSDGTGLRLVALSARVVVQGPLAFTELHLTFENPENRQREGRFTIDLPSGASVRRLAMKLPDGWQEGEVVERQAARQIYEDYLHRKQDPALLERAAGNRFRARVFPIPAGGHKEIKLAYVEALSQRRGYRLRLEGLPAIGRLRVEAQVAYPRGRRGLTWRRTVLDRAGRVPRRDFVLPVVAAIEGLRQGRQVVARVRPRGAAEPVPIDSLMVLVDTSASRAAGFARQIARVGRVLERLRAIHGDALALQLACFDQEVTPIFEGRIGAFGARQLRQILDRRALGASDLVGALRWAAQHRGPARLVLVTDGVVSAGSTDDAVWREVIGALRPTVSRIDVVLVGGIRDAAAMTRVVRRTTRWLGASPQIAEDALSRNGVVLDGELSSDELARRLSQSVIPAVGVAIPGARWHRPRRLEGLQPGDEALVFAELASQADRADAGPLQLVLSEPDELPRRYSVSLRPADGVLLHSALTEARIATLQDDRARATGTTARDALRRQIVELSTRQRVLSDHTALLVLESAAEYARYGIDRRSLADLLVVGDRGVMRQDRGVFVVPPAVAARPRREAAQTRGAPSPEGAPVSAARLAGPVGARPAPRGARSPNRDQDHDRIADQDDRCPGEPETYNGHEDGDGCPDRGRVVVHHGRIEILDKIYFESGRARIRPISRPILEAIVATLRGNPQIARVEIQGHTDRRGAARANRQLARRRARAVRRYLTAGGIAPGRLIARGYGSERPVDRRWGPGAWSRNRRVEFHIRRRDDDAPAPLSFKGRAGGMAPRAVAGRLGQVLRLLEQGRLPRALALARRWQREEPGDLLALVALGRALAAAGRKGQAARAVGSIIDLFPSRADLRRFAAGQLEALGEAGRPLALDSYEKALVQRPDHPSAYRLLALAQLRAGDPDAALATLEAGLSRGYRIYRSGVLRVLRGDLGLVAAAIVARAPTRRQALGRRLARLGATIASRPSLRFVLTWETDANDVDLHVVDGRGNRASYAAPALASGGRLQNDVTNGYGPESFAIAGRARAFPYRLAVHYFSRGPMGYGLGKVQVVQHDGRGRLRFRDLPFVVTDDNATLQLGRVAGPL